MNLNRNTRLSESELDQTTLQGATVFGPDDSRIGHVSKVLGAGSTTEVVIDVGGFLGLGAHSVLVSARDLEFVRDDSNSIMAVTSWTKEDLRGMPEFKG
ncbi:MAG: PRC-barrel domain-containing protein [Paracoccus sp. (in: a-proteobacteria)]|nr:PRC-barrel domain-containing protein [Paracoccus sp. (in: a-proteobacteria)]